MPKRLVAGVLYVSDEFGTAAHLCACGCGRKIRTPLGPTEWTLTETDEGPSLHPSIGNWQRACRSHYWITDGKIRWAETWSQERIEAGRRQEQAQREAYFRAANKQEAVGIEEREQHASTPEAAPPENLGFFAAIWRRVKWWLAHLWY